MDDFQIKIATTDLILGAGTDYIVHGWEGLGIMGLRTSDRERPLDHGTFVGAEYLEGRDISIPLTIRGDNAEDAMQKLDALLTAWYFDSRAQVDYDATTTLHVQLPGKGERLLRGRPRRVKPDITNLISGKIPASLEFFASDPRWYGATLHDRVLIVSAEASGYGFPRQFDYGFGGGTSPVITVQNSGTIGTLPTFRVHGPITNFSLRNQTTGKELRITYTLPAGQYLDIDFAAKTVLLGGTASRYFAKSGEWWEIEPGLNSIRLTAVSGEGTATMNWRDAWL